MGWKYLDVFVLVMGCFGYTSAQIYFLGKNEIPITKTALNMETAGKPSLGKFSSNGGVHHELGRGGGRKSVCL